MGARRSAAAALLLMVAAMAGAVAWKPTRHLTDHLGRMDLEAVFPKTFGEWRVDERMPAQLVSPDVQAKLNELYNQTLSRTYVNARGQRVMLSVAYGGDQSDGTRAHLPEVCYPAQGFAIGDKSVDKVAGPGHDIRVRRMIARLGSRVEPITYWLIVGDKVAISGTEMKLAQLRYSALGVIPDGMLVRVSSIDNDSAAAYAVHASFVAAMTAAIPQTALARVTGVAGA
jgi:EpsI family protein